MTTIRHIALLLTWGIAVSCTRADGAVQEAGQRNAGADTGAMIARDTSYRMRPGYVVDSAHGSEELLRRFRVGLAPVRSLAGDSESPEALLRGIVAAAARHDTASLVRTAVTRAEWGWLYYPASHFRRPPYESPPELQWALTLAASEKGMRRLLRELGGHELRVEQVRCGTPVAEGAHRLWGECRVTYASDGATATRRITGTLLERDGRVKVLSFANDF